MKLKENDEVISAALNNYNDIMIGTHNCYSLWFNLNEVPTSGIKSTGVKAILLKSDYVVASSIFDKNSEYVTIFSDRNTAKRVKLQEFEIGTRARKGLLILREIKSNPHKIKKIFISDYKCTYGLKKEKDIEYIKNTELPILDRYKTGSTISKEDILDIFEQVSLIKKDNDDVEETKEVSLEKITKPVQISLLEIDDKLKEIDDILDN